MTFKSLQNTLEYLYKTTNVIEGTNRPEIYAELLRLQSDLMLCEKALADYLETKRLAFPRFYFVSSADLLDILSSGNEPREVGRHLTKLFDSLAAIIFTKNEDEEDSSCSNIGQAMKAKDGEIVEFNVLCECVGAVEIWLGRVESVMRSTIRHYMSISIHDYPSKPREKWILGIKIYSTYIIQS